MSGKILYIIVTHGSLWGEPDVITFRHKRIDPDNWDARQKLLVYHLGKNKTSRTENPELKLVETMDENSIEVWSFGK